MWWTSQTGLPYAPLSQTAYRHAMSPLTLPLSPEWETNSPSWGGGYSPYMEGRDDGDLGMVAAGAGE